MRSISRLLLFGILLACFVGQWNTQNRRNIAAAQQHPAVSITRIYTASDGQTHAGEMDANLMPVAGRAGFEQSVMIRTTGVTFARRAPGLIEDWHTAPRRQYGITLSGRGEVEVAGVKRFGSSPGASS